jgi:opacity protein-like surface antigen
LIPLSPSTTSALPALALLLLVALCGPARAAAADDTQLLSVAEPYLELHEGPGRGYAVTQVVPRGEAVEVLYRRTEWFRVRTRRGIEGWAHEAAMRMTLRADGSAFSFDLGNRDGFTAHRWELGFAAGDYGGATLIGTHLSFSFNEQMALELTGSQFLGSASNGYAAELGLVHVYRPDWRVSPLLTLGTGSIWINPKSTTVNVPDRNDQTAYVGAGLRFYMTRRFFLRGEYRHHLVFTSRDSNEEIKEWKLALAFFF